MLDLRFLRENYEEIRKKLESRGEDLSEFEQFPEFDEKRRKLISQTEVLKAERNEASKQISVLKREGKDADEAITKMRQVSDQIKEYDEQLSEVQQRLNLVMLSIPNIPHETAPIGESEDDNVVVRTWGEKKEFDFEAQAHWDLAEKLDILDFERASKVAGSRFVFYKGLGARLERALINFMMDFHADEHGYEEMIPPFLVNRASMTGTGQLPKFAEDAFHIENWDYYLIPTSEVPVTNYYRDEILTGEDLPKKFVAYSANFRSEAGSAGRDTRGLIRQHQFNKVELVRLVKPEESYEALEELTNNAEKILQLLGLPYQVLNMCTADLGFTAAKKYDIEVWVPSQNKYREISSCSNFEDFQARRANLRFRRDRDSKPEFMHTLNGSGVAVGRTVTAILENYQEEDGSVVIPEVLRPYMGGLEKIDCK